MPTKEKEASATPAPTMTNEVPASIAARRERQQRRGQGGDTKTAPLSHAKMTGLPDGVPIGSVVLNMKAPTVRNTRKVIAGIWNGWPYVLVMAALSDATPGAPLDPTRIAAYWTKSEKAEKPDAEEITPEEVRGQLRALANSLVLEDSPQVQEILGNIAGVLALVCDPLPAPLEAMPEWLLDTFTLPELVDLLRAIWDTAGGFPGDVRERFSGAS